VPVVVPSPGAADPFGSLEDVAVALMRPLDDGEAAAAAAWLVRLSAEVRSRRPLVDSWVMAGLLDPVVVAGVVVDAIVRRLRNPGGLSEEAVDDYRYRRAELGSDGALVIPPDDWARIQPAGVVSGRRVRSVRMVAPGER